MGPGWPLEYRVVLLQVACVVLAAGAAAAIGSSPGAVLVGGSCALLPNAWMALRARRRIAAGVAVLAHHAGLLMPDRSGEGMPPAPPRAGNDDW